MIPSILRKNREIVLFYSTRFSVYNYELSETKGLIIIIDLEYGSEHRDEHDAF